MSSAEAGSPLAAFLRALPKVELHVHLEGSVRPATLLALARRHGIELPARDEAGLADWFRFRDFEHFVEVYVACSRCLRDGEDFHRLALDFAEGQAAQNVLWSEVHFTISTHLAHGADGDEVAAALAAAAAEAERRWGTRLRFIPDVVRNQSAERAAATLEWALRHRDAGVVAIGAAGVEGAGDDVVRGPFAEAATGGLHRVAHAGEQLGADSVWRALDELGAERIGHGIRAVEDPSLVERLARERVPLEVCPSSNVALGFAPSLADHPFDRLWRSGVAVSVNSDDPPLFGTTLDEEYLSLARTFGYGAAELAELARAPLDHAFLEPAERSALTTEFDRRLAAARAEVDLVT